MYSKDNKGLLPKSLVMGLIISGFLVPQILLSSNVNDAIEPQLVGPEVIDMSKELNSDDWKVPSKNWSFENGVITGQTGEKKLTTPEWLYTKQQFSDFEFTCELRLTGDLKRNTGIYYRAKPISYVWKKKSFEAPSGYEFDAAYHHPGKRNFRGTLGDWYKRPSLRIFPDADLINQAYHEETWNRMTIRARANRLEYWMNGTKIMDYLDSDPEASKEGIIGFQIHDGSVMKVEYRNIRVRPID